jgi:pre-mRNA-processing factor SLU7
MDGETADDEFRRGETGEALVFARDPKIKTTTKNLRIREDTAKYLLNRDVNSAYYDPKSRAMRENPNPHLPPE